MKARYDVAIAGAGILGLAHAYHLARRGLSVIVFERQQRAQGASVRNFGMIWPIGQPPGPAYDLARRSRDIWLDVLRASGLWHDPCGSLHLAYHDDEAAVLREFVAAAGSACSATLLRPAEIIARFPAVQPKDLRGGMWSPIEVTVDPRQVITELPDYLHRVHSVDFSFATTVLNYDCPHVRATNGECQADRLLVCTGIDFHELAPNAFADAGLVPCKLQMMRSAPLPRVGTMLAAGLTLRHYRAFADCPSLPALVNRFDRESLDFARFGIHVMLSQHENGQLTIGDSHEYGDAIDPFDKPHIDALILQYLRTFIHLSELAITSRWHGVYVKHPSELFVSAEPAPGMKVVTGVGGAGMTLSFGLAEKCVGSWLGDLQ
jgi:FAD dependent oxidoreductase TIGR03364